MAGVTKEKFKEGYDLVFGEQWPLWLGGIFLGLLSVLTFAWARPWGVFGGVRVWGDWVLHALGIYQHAGRDPWTSSSSILSIGLLWGAFGSALLSRQFALRMAPGLEIIKGLVGGAFMGVGAAMAGGCNVGGFYTSVSAMSMSGFAMMVGLIIGAYVGLRYLLWELEKFPPKQTAVQSSEKKQSGIDWGKVQPYVGAAVLLVGVILAFLYSNRAYTKIGGLLLFGMAFGLVIQRSRFCFVRGFRDPFMTGEGAAPRAIAISVIISVTGFAILKYGGLRPESAYVTARFWLGGLLGGFIFGMGMVVAGGCGSGTLWRVGEGQIKLWFALLTFALVGSLWRKFMETSGLLAKIGKAVFLPNLVGYSWALIIIIAVMIIYFWVATWNEETDKFTVM